MSNEELCILAQQGDPEARNALILNNQNYIYKEANALKAKLELPPWIVEDMIQECTFSFIEAIQRFDASRGTKFLTYADFWIRKSCQKILDDFMPSRELVSLYQELGYDDDTILMDLVLDENALDPEECGIRAATIQQVRKALEAIPDRDRMYLHSSLATSSFFNTPSSFSSCLTEEPRPKPPFVRVLILPRVLANASTPFTALSVVVSI